MKSETRKAAGYKEPRPTFATNPSGAHTSTKVRLDALPARVRTTPSRRDISLSLAGLAAFAVTPISRPAFACTPVVKVTALSKAATAAQERFGLPALAVLCARGGNLLEEAAVGLRARREPLRVSTQDRWHIGSCAKAITATLIARFIERRLLDWDTPMSDALPRLKEEMDPLAARITVYQLLTMMSGLPENPNEVAGGGGLSIFSSTSDLVRQLKAIEGLAPDDQGRRRLIAERILAKKPLSVPGSRFGYSNTNYIILGAIAEEIGGESFETLLEQEVFAPLGIHSFGFGAPGRDSVIDEPRGHEARRSGLAVKPQSAGADLPSFLRPAGGVNIALTDWLPFVQDHLSGEQAQGALLSRDTYLRLHTVAPGNTQPYACGWGAVSHGGRRLLTHTGNNTLWTATVRAYPSSGYVCLYASNDGRVGESSKAFDQVRADLEARHPAF